MSGSKSLLGTISTEHNVNVICLFDVHSKLNSRLIFSERFIDHRTSIYFFLLFRLILK